MPVTLDSFTSAAQSTIFDSRRIIFSKDKGEVKLGKVLISPGTEINQDTMKAFKDALHKECGVFGDHAFETVVGTRAQKKFSLRACDIKETISVLDTVRINRYVGEMQRQFDTSPAMLELSLKDQDRVQQLLKGSAKSFLPYLRKMKTQEELDSFVASKIETTIMAVKGMSPTDAQKVGGKGHVDKPVKSDEPTGLDMLTSRSIVDGKSTSVEDRIKNSTLGAGMRVNKSATSPMLLEKLKTNGVEPGFIFRHDWSVEDTRGFMADPYSKEAKDEMEAIIAKRPDLQSLRELGITYREIGLMLGREHSAGVSFAAEFILERELGKPDSAISKAFAEKFPGMTKEMLFPPRDELFGEADLAEPTEAQKKNLAKVKMALFAQIRDAVMDVKKGDAAYTVSPIFKHFQERNIAKLDYNEKDRIVKWGPGSDGTFLLPERCSVKGGVFKGFFFRNFRFTSADKASAGAVSEAFANDLTRLLGVPAQELSLFRGEYSDGHPKLMLAAKFADGYHDFEDGYLKDGQIVSPDGKPLESLGKYKALFLALADRDAVGSHGQNKGIVEGHFFAIDPGHSLEGQGKDLGIRDNLSFKDEGFFLKRLFEKRFLNYSVFDDDTRFSKLEGVIKLRELKQTGKIEELAGKYKQAFRLDEPHISYEEKELRKEIGKNIDKMVSEFTSQIDRIIKTCDSQLELYDALKPDGAEVQKNAIEMIENLEKLTSPTTWKSPKGEVNLKHLAVLPETRTPWSAKADTLNITYKSSKPLNLTNQTRLMHYAQQAGIECTFDSKGFATVVVPRETPEAAFNTFSEDKIAEGLYPDEARLRRTAAAMEM